MRISDWSSDVCSSDLNQTRLMQWTRSQSVGLLQLSRTVIGGAGVGAPRNGKKEKPMSVRMALAKLCACTCGGAIIGSGAMKIADVPATAQVQTCCKQKVVRQRHAAKRPVKRVSRGVTTQRELRTATPQPTGVQPT